MVSTTSLIYTFDSVGPRGVIPKVVRYNLENGGQGTYLNLVFGNRCNESDSVDTLSVSNNGDRAKLLATVAATVIDVTGRFPDMTVYAKGSTRARTRLYQMGIFGHWDLIAPLFDVFAYINGIWVPAVKNVNYDAFAVKRKLL